MSGQTSGVEQVQEMEQVEQVKQVEQTQQAESTEKKETARDANYWAQPVSKLKITDVPKGAINLNMDGRQITSPLQGFGRMWQRTYRIKIGGNVTPAQVVEDWKKNFPAYQPSNNHFYPSLAGIKPGEVLFIDTMLPVIPGLPGIMPVAVGVMVLYADDETFTVMTPEGHPFAGWNTFSSFEENGAVYAQVQALCRPSDPIYEFGYRFMGGEAVEDRIWVRVLELVAQRWGVNAQVELEKSCLDPKVQWREWRRIRRNAAVRTLAWVLLSPFRLVHGHRKPAA